MPMSTADQNYIQAIVNAVNAYATAMEAFTSGAATTAANAMAASLTAANTTWAASVNRQGE